MLMSRGDSKTQFLLKRFLRISHPNHRDCMGMAWSNRIIMAMLYAYDRKVNFVGIKTGYRRD